MQCIFYDNISYLLYLVGFCFSIIQRLQINNLHHIFFCKNMVTASYPFSKTKGN